MGCIHSKLVDSHGHDYALDTLGSSSSPAQASALSSSRSQYSDARFDQISQNRPPKLKSPAAQTAYTSGTAAQPSAETRTITMPHAVFSKSPMTLETKRAIAQVVLEDVRNLYYKHPNLKSCNKIRLHAERDSEIRRVCEAANQMGELYKNYTLDNIKKSKAHNCGELSRLAVDMLLKNNLKAVKIGIVGVVGTHAFAAVLPPSHPDYMGFDMGSDMSKWSEDIIICDPWCNISCSAPYFNDFFSKKMDKWVADGKILANSYGGYKEYLANNEDWVRDVVSGEKKIDFVQ